MNGTEKQGGWQPDDDVAGTIRLAVAATASNSKTGPDARGREW